MLASDRAVRTGICARAVSGQLSTFHKHHFHTLLNDSLEEIEEEWLLLKIPVAIFGECGVMRNLLIEAQPGEPTIRQVHANVLD